MEDKPKLRLVNSEKSDSKPKKELSKVVALKRKAMDNLVEREFSKYQATLVKQEIKTDRNWEPEVIEGEKGKYLQKAIDFYQDYIAGTRKWWPHFVAVWGLSMGVIGFALGYKHVVDEHPSKVRMVGDMDGNGIDDMILEQRGGEIVPLFGKVRKKGITYHTAKQMEQSEPDANGKYINIEKDEGLLRKLYFNQQDF
jgi:hypothetical protein